MKKKRIARPLLIASAGVAVITMGTSCLISGNLVVRPCPDGGTSCYSDCEFNSTCSTDAGATDAGKADGGVDDGGTRDGGP
ncbi:MAG: hypothetical protein Q8L14_26370 [Myxococcales bacterium]|nr:hypothetical protein [Myxococcales bacterium]